jgi:uncharacterized protein YjbI with pentapeptide repeats
MRGVAVIARTRPARIAGWALAAILAVAAVTAYGVALWRAPGWMHATTPQDRYNARVLVISVGGAIVVGTGLLYTARNYRLSRRGQVTDRFTTALERLGSGELYVRIGGVHALEHVMRDSAGHHDDVIEVLAKFIRGRAPRRARRPDRQVWMHPVTGSVPDLPSQPAPDIQAALTALGHRPSRPERQPIDLTGLHLAAAQLGGANLTGAQLSGTDLTRAWLDSADLTRAGLADTNLAGAWLDGANLGGAGLRGANLTGAHLYIASLAGAWLAGANLTGAQLIRTKLTHAVLEGTDLTDAVLNSANLTRARLAGTNLTGAMFIDADLTRAWLADAIWPSDVAAPKGWRRDDSGRLAHAGAGPGRKATTLQSTGS